MDFDYVMKELVVISGKGGTGKTSLVASFAALARSAVIADCDVDAPDLHIVLNPIVQRLEPFSASKTAVIDADLCLDCGTCRSLCHFEAIGPDGVVNKIACEGCGVCAHFCPAGAIEMRKRISGEWYRSNTRLGPMVHARIGIAEGNSGLLVSLVREQALKFAEAEGRSLVIIDGPPGTGCPVIASMKGANLVLVVTEPTVSGIHDLKRALELADHFGTPALVCINKWDLNPEVTEEIKVFCRAHSVPVVGTIPYSEVFTDAQLAGLSVVEYASGPVVGAVVELWARVSEMVEKTSAASHSEEKRAAVKHVGERVADS